MTSETCISFDSPELNSLVNFLGDPNMEFYIKIGEKLSEYTSKYIKE